MASMFPVKGRLFAHAIAATLCAGALLALAGCDDSSSTDALHADIDTIVVIYAENRSFDNLYGLFPGANGIADAGVQSKTQLDRDGVTPLATLPQVWNATSAQAPSLAFVSTLPNGPFRIDAPPGGVPGLASNITTPDLVHRFYNNQMQINGGKNNMFVAWSDAGGLAMGYYDGTPMAMWKLAQQFTLADNFFIGSFGGSFLNHFWLVCACTPPFPNAPASTLSSPDSSGTKLLVAGNSPASALIGKPVYVADRNVTPDFFAINTPQPSYQPSGTAPASGGDARLADPAGNPLPPVDSAKVKTIGDTLTSGGVSWKWYAGAWNQALADRSVIYNNTVPNFQAHHQPFNYFNRFDPTTSSGQTERNAHLKDYTDLSADITSGSLPHVVFYKPQGNLNQHPGYTDVQSGDAHIAEVVGRLMASPQWSKMAIIVTYDENGGFWDHATPPAGDRWGPGTRIPTIVVSPFARKSYVDHTQYDTTSILKFMTRRFDLDALPGVRAGAGDLTNAFSF